MTWRQPGAGHGVPSLRLPPRSGLRPTRRPGADECPEAVAYEDEPAGTTDGQASTPVSDNASDAAKTEAVER